MPNTDYTDSLHFSAAETAKVIRKELKAAFPGVKFSVTSSNFSMGDAVRVGWTNGPSRKAVNALIERYQSYSTDGMHKYLLTPDGKRAYYAMFVSSSRDYTKEVIDAAIKSVMEEYQASSPSDSVKGWLDSRDIARQNLEATSFDAAVAA